MPVTLIDNPLMQHKLGSLRNVDTQPDSFRRILSQMSVQIFYEAARGLPHEARTITTPFATAEVNRINKSVALLPVMRAGLGMAESILNLWPDAAVGHIGIYRDKFLKNTVEYYFKMPKGVAKASVFVLDPIIATGDTAIATVDRLKEIGCSDINYLSFLTSSQGKDTLMTVHPDVHLFAVCTEDEINDEGYLTPGLGDVGARYYNTI
ncbi:Uracil phosphoribosyltransferase [Thalassocella blandensis]|nr:Uracil phosphoribosyltransferase [Thalassocella blandensis]